MKFLQITILTILLHSTLTLTTTTTTTTTTITVHELLKKKGLPQGLLPKEVKSYEYNEENGVLNVYFDEPCLTKFENRVLFDSVVRANLSFGELLAVEGLSQEELFIWLPVKEISVNDPLSGVILFDIGMAQKQLSLSLFEVPPSCTSLQGNINYRGRKDKGFEAKR